jgi:hypothetical protein
MFPFKYRQARRNQALTETHKTARMAFCWKMLGMARSLPKIHFLDESRIDLGGDKRWIWFRKGDDNPAVSISFVKFPPPVMVFAVIGITFKSDLLLVEGSIAIDRYLQNLDRLGDIDVLNAKHVMFGWIFQQDGGTGSHFASSP